MVEKNGEKCWEKMYSWGIRDQVYVTIEFCLKVCALYVNLLNIMELSNNNIVLCNIEEKSNS